MSNPVTVFLSSKAESSQRVYECDLRVISILFGQDDPYKFAWHLLKYEDTQRIREVLSTCPGEQSGKVLSPISVNRILCALRGVLKTCWRMGVMPAEDYTRAVDIDNVIGSTVPAGRQLENREMNALLQVCDSSTIGIRDAAIISLMYSCGLRRSEVTDLDLSDYDPVTNELIINGKRNKQRLAYVTGGAALAMLDWLNIRGTIPGPLFLPVHRDGNMVLRRLTSQTIYDMLNRRGEQARIDHFSPHDMRRSFVSSLLGLGVDISTVAMLAGHVSISTTAKYDRRPDKVRREAAELIQVSYRGRRKGAQLGAIK